MFKMLCLFCFLNKKGDNASQISPGSSRGPVAMYVQGPGEVLCGKLVTCNK